MDQRTAFKIVKEYLSFLHKSRFDFQKAYIFGSYAKGNFTEDSDIDLAVIIRNLSNSFIAQIELMKLGRKIDSRIEPHPFDETDFNLLHPFAKEILTFGIEIK